MKCNEREVQDGEEKYDAIENKNRFGAMKNSLKHGIGVAKVLCVDCMIKALNAFDALQSEKVIPFDIQRKMLGHLRIGQAGSLLDKIVIVTGVELKGIAFERQAIAGNQHCEPKKGKSKGQEDF